tara:strand:- start:745 stop:1860 length:1116 start_codon:yes stop_codon:yes gene_type:complete
MKLNKIKELVSDYDKLDYFLNKAYWHNLESTENLKKDTSGSIKDFINFLVTKNIDFFLDDLTFQAFHSKKLYNKERTFESIILKPNEKKTIIANLTDLISDGYSLIMFSQRKMHFIKDKKIIKIIFSYTPFLLSLKSKNLDIKNLQINGPRVASKSQKLFFYRNIFFNKEFLKQSFFKYSNIKKSKQVIEYKKLSYDEFLTICIEDKKSINWLLRKPHLDLVTNNKKNLKVNDILNYFKRPGLLDSKLNKIVETDTSSSFTEPVHLNKKFWLSGNNFYIYPLIFRFKKDVIAYKKANEYINKNHNIKLYSKKYFLSLEDMNTYEIEEMFKNNPLEITNGALTSGRHRAFAMIGRLLVNEAYIPIFTRIVKV